MDKSDDNPKRFQVCFTGQALVDWREAFPQLPPGDEVVLWVEMEPCSICGEKIKDKELACFDPEAITTDGLLIGKHICIECAQSGHWRGEVMQTL